MFYLSSKGEINIMPETFVLNDEFVASYADTQPAWGPLGQVVYSRTYARWLESESRRERWHETVKRVVEFSMHLDTALNAEQKKEEAEQLFDAIFRLKGFPSGRTLWMGGSDFSYSNASSISNFNCSSHSIESADDLHDLVYLLMSGTGGGPRITGDVVATFNRNHPLAPRIAAPVGYLPYVYAGAEHAPEVSELHSQRILTVGDSRAGWAQAVAMFVTELSAGRSLAVNFNFIRPLGTRLKSFGGYASGPEPLLTGFREIEKIIEAARLRGSYTDLDLMDICCLIGRLVVAGGTRRCLPAGTLVKTTAGAIAIENVKPGMEVETPEGIKPILHLFDQGEQQTIKIVHAYGEFSCTPNHQMAVFDRHDNWIFKEARSITSDDRLVWDFGVWGGKNRKIPQLSEDRVENSYIRNVSRSIKRERHPGVYCGLDGCNRPAEVKSSGLGHPLCNAHYLRLKNLGDVNSFRGRAVEVSLPDEVNTDFAWLIGLIHGDGYIRYTGPKGHITIACSKDYPEIIEKSTRILQQLCPDTQVAHIEFNGYVNVTLRSRRLAQWMFEHVKQPKTEISIPEWITQSSPDVRAAYLAGLFDADGSAQTRGWRLVSTVYPGFAKQIFSLCATLGFAVKDYVVDRNNLGWKTLHNLDVVGAEFWNIAIQMLSPYASTKLNSAIQHVKQRSGRGGLSFTPIQAQSAGVYPGRSRTNATMGVTAVIKDTDVTLRAFPVPVLGIEMGEYVYTYDIEVKDIHQFTAGGFVTHNSALMLLGDSTEFSNAKTGEWYNTHPWRSQANITVVQRGKPTRAELDKSFDRLMQYGEPGFINEDGAKRRRKDFNGCNPCGEILLCDDSVCNLTELNMIAFVKDGVFNLKEASRVHSLLARHGLRITNLNITGMRGNWDAVQKRDRLLGCGLTGIGDYIDACQPSQSDLEETFAALKVAAERGANDYADKMGVPHPLLNTTIKPSGTLSLLPGVSSGVHAAFAPLYVRRIRIAAVDAVAQALKFMGVPSEPDSFNPGTEVFSFPVKSLATRRASDYTAIEQLERYLTTMKFYTAHNTSVTIYIADDEVEAVKDWMEANWDDMVAVSFLKKEEGMFPQMPYEAIELDAYNALEASMPSLKNFTSYLEGIESAGMMATELDADCLSGACPVR
jgi:hypothetical protein